MYTKHCGKRGMIHKSDRDILFQVILLTLLVIKCQALIRRLERDELLEELVLFYVNSNQE